MEEESDVDIIIFSESEESEEAIRAQADRALSLSIISKATVDRLRVPYTLCQPPPVTDSKRTSHHPIGRVELRWHKRDKAKSYPELFYIVESTTPLVILGASAFSQGNQSAGSEVHTLGLAQQTAEEKRRQEQRKLEAQQRRAKEKKEQERREAQKRVEKTVTTAR